MEISVERGRSAADCPGDAALSARVERIRPVTARSPDGASATRVEVGVSFERSTESYAARIDFRGARQGQRQLADRSATCDGLAEAVAVAIALTLDRDEPLPARDADGAVTPTSSAGDGANARPAGDASESALPPPVKSGQRQRWSFGVLLESGAAFSFGSSLGWSVGGRARAVHAGWSFELSARAILPATVETGPARLQTRWLLGEAGVCKLFGWSYALGPCVSFAVAQARGRGLDFGENRAANLIWVAPGGGVTFVGRWPRPWTWGLSATLWVPVRELTFSAENSGILWRSSAVSSAAAINAGLEFD